MDKNKFKKALRAAGVTVFILLGALAIYNLAIKPKINDLNHYAELLGDKLLAMVPEGSGKAALAQTYRDFLEKVRNREVAPEGVERVAAGILNLSNSNKVITPEQAETVIQLAFSIPPADSLKTAPKIVSLPSVHPRNWETTGKRLKLAFEFNEKMQHAPLSTPSPEQPLSRQMQFSFDKGIKIRVDKNIKAELAQHDLQELAREFQKLENEKLVLWQDDLAKEMETELRKMEAELARVQVELEQQDIQVSVHVEHARGVIKSIEGLDSLGILIPVNLDSILTEVEKELEKAEIKAESK